MAQTQKQAKLSFLNEVLCKFHIAQILSLHTRSKLTFCKIFTLRYSVSNVANSVLDICLEINMEEVSVQKFMIVIEKEFTFLSGCTKWFYLLSLWMQS